MKIPFVTQIANLDVKITPAKNTIKDIIGFVDINLEDEKGQIIFKARGYTIKVKNFGNSSPVFTVNAPAYKSGYKYKTSFIFENKTQWLEITRKILSEFNELTGDLSPEDFLPKNEEVNPNDIPL